MVGGDFFGSPGREPKERFVDRLDMRLGKELETLDNLTLRPGRFNGRGKKSCRL